MKPKLDETEARRNRTTRSTRRWLLVSVLTSRPALRWAVPAGVLVVALGAGATGRMLVADAAPALPERTAAQLLVDLQTARPDGFSGTVVQKADLGLPNLPINTGSQGSSDFNALVTGTHTLRVWYGGEARQRVALLGTLGESDLVRNGRDLWAWSSEKNTATHTRLPERSTGAEEPRPTPTDLPSTPQEAADAALAALDPTTSVTTDGTATVADRAAYELVLKPKDTASKIGQVRLAVDAEEKVPLRVRVYARDATTPAIEVGFTQVSFSVPPAQQFRFTPPPGATVKEEQADTPDPSKLPRGLAQQARPEVVGKGWTSVVVVRNVDPSASAGTRAEGGTQLDAVLGSLPRVSGDWGSGRLLTSKLFSALVLDDGRVLIGAVDPEKLYEAAR
jgi:outer membrane lipoprotein-sorting protein